MGGTTSAFKSDTDFLFLVKKCFASTSAAFAPNLRRFLHISLGIQTFYTAMYNNNGFIKQLKQVATFPR